MILSQNNHTPVDFWLRLPLEQLLQWIKDNNDLIKSTKKVR